MVHTFKLEVEVITGDDIDRDQLQQCFDDQDTIFPSENPSKWAPDDVVAVTNVSINDKFNSSYSFNYDGREPDPAGTEEIRAKFRSLISIAYALGFEDAGALLCAHSEGLAGC